ncbi:F-box/LRR-repeat protein-like [Iris pallida]|uniref:F-box/LRR-repeat protein-like n=1 Tax=Iris pallida TaxID=29817 RepID=A0AAX6HBL9_IRIPA|nr:F-box/LRR-repeat protein-like [Iris pallida]
MKMEEEDDGSKWKEMEMDCLVLIFQKLSLQDLTLNVSYVCKTWFQASLSPLCWRVLDFRTLDFTPGSKFSRRFAAARYPSSRPAAFSAFMKLAVRRSCGAAVELRFPLFFEVSTEDLVRASTGCPKLKVLGMDSLRPESELHLPRLIGKWKELEQLEMETGPSSISDLAAAIGLDCRNFRGLSMSGEVKMEDALAIVECLPKLKELNLSRSYLPKRELLAIMDGCRELETLSVKYCVGFKADDEEILGRACGTIKLEHEGSKLREDFGYGVSVGSMCVVFVSDIDDCMYRS